MQTEILPLGMSSNASLLVSKKAANLVGSEIIRLAGEINALMAGGAQIFNFTIGDFDPAVFPIPEALKDEIIAAYQAGHTNYPPSAGIASLLTTMAAFTKSRQGLDYPASDFLIAGGARPLIFAAYQAVVDPGEKVIFPVPSWNNNHYTHLADGQKVFVETGPETNFMPTADVLAPHLDGAAMIALCSPQNPTGTTFTKEQLEAICDLVLAENKRRGPDRKPLYVLYDQIYWLLTFGETQHHDPVSLRPEMRPYTIFIDGLSKSLAATGVRVGWSFGPSAVINNMKNILGHVGAWAPKAEQIASAKFFNREADLDAYLGWIRKAVHTRLEGFYQGMIALKAQGHKVDAIAPQAAIYLTVCFDLAGKTTADGRLLAHTRDVQNYLLMEAGLAIVPFYAFGADDNSPWYRLSVGTAKVDEIPAVFARLGAALAALH
jgi:aspartate aminotransferase